jgi:hypothetical protein
MTAASTYGRISEKFKLMRSEYEYDEWPKGYLGLVQSNDPTLIFKAPPRNPYFYNIDFEYGEHERELFEVYKAISENKGRVSKNIKGKYPKELLKFCQYVYNNRIGEVLNDVFIIKDLLDEFLFNNGANDRLKIYPVHESNFYFDIWYYGYIAEFIHVVDNIAQPFDVPFGSGLEPKTEYTHEEQTLVDEFNVKLDDYLRPNRHIEVLESIISKIHFTKI